MTTTNQKPVIVLVPGAWHTPKHYEPVPTLLTAAGYDVTSIHLATVGRQPPVSSHHVDASLIRDAVVDIADQGRDVVVITHSYGGIPAAEAMKGLSKQERKNEGKSGGVVRLIYISSFLLKTGGHLLELLNDEAPPWFRIEGNSVWTKADTPLETFYNDIDPEIAKKLESQVESFAYLAFFSKLTYTPWHLIPVTYVICELDQAMPKGLQEQVILNAGVPVDVERIQTSHHPFVSQPQIVANIIKKWAN